MFTKRRLCLQKNKQGTKRTSFLNIHTTLNNPLKSHTKTIWTLIRSVWLLHTFTTYISYELLIQKILVTYKYVPIVIHRIVCMHLIINVRNGTSSTCLSLSTALVSLMLILQWNESMKKMSLTFVRGKLLPAKLYKIFCITKFL